MKYQYRLYQPADLEGVVTVYRESVRALAAPFYTAAQLAAWAPKQADLEQWRHRLAQLKTIIAEGDGSIAGFASYDLSGHLDLLFTHPAFARRGVATHLYDKVEDALRSAGVTRVFTEASLAARPFFERWDFQVEAEETVEVRGQQLRRFRMHKLLAPAAGES